MDRWMSAQLSTWVDHWMGRWVDVCMHAVFSYADKQAPFRVDAARCFHSEFFAPSGLRTFRV